MYISREQIMDIIIAFMMIFTMKQHQKNWNLHGQTQSLV